MTDPHKDAIDAAYKQGAFEALASLCIGVAIAMGFVLVFLWLLP